jgi:hypothetical protein
MPNKACRRREAQLKQALRPFPPIQPNDASDDGDDNGRSPSINKTHTAITVHLRPFPPSQPNDETDDGDGKRPFLPPPLKSTKATPNKNNHPPIPCQNLTYNCHSRLRGNPSGCPSKKAFIQIAPIRILFLNQINLPLPAPLFHLFLASYGFLNIPMYFIPN